MIHFVSQLSSWFVPVLIICILILAIRNKVDAYSEFVEGGKEGITLAFELIPFILGMLVAITILRSSGALDAFITLCTPLFEMIGIPPEVVPLAFIRPISGTASLSMLAQITQDYGADSFIGRVAATMQGSTDTTFYILTVYFGAVNITKIRYAWKVGLLADIVGIIISIVIVQIIFGR